AGITPHRSVQSKPAKTVRRRSCSVVSRKILVVRQRRYAINRPEPGAVQHSHEAALARIASHIGKALIPLGAALRAPASTAFLPAGTCFPATGISSSAREGCESRAVDSPGDR